MTDVPIWKQIRTYVEADPEHQRLSEAHRELLVAQRQERDTVKARAEAVYAEMRACAEQLEAEYRAQHAGTTGPCSG